MDENLTLDAGLSRSIQYCRDSAEPKRLPRVALLTGATGFLGVHLLQDLLACTSLEMVCLVRASSEHDTINKLRCALQAYKLWRPEFAGRIYPLTGNLAEPRLGLSDREFFALGKRLDVIYHNGAQINLVLPYRALRATNVLGTLELLRLAAIAPVQAFHYISSIAVFGLDGSELQSEIKDDFCICQPPRLSNGYAKTKWVAEQLVNEAAKSGLAASIYRPGMISGHSRTGICNRHDSFSLTLRACLRLDVAPEFTGITYLTPVDFVSRAILELSQSEASLGKAFHIINPLPISWDEVRETMLTGGHVHRTLPYQEWLHLLRTEAEKPSQKNLTPIAALMPNSPPASSRVPVGRNTADGVARLPEVRCLADNSALLKLYLSYLSSLE